EYMDNEVFAKAGVAAGFLHNSDDELKHRGFALGYQPDGSKNWSSLPVRGTPAAGAYATAPDLLSLHKALASGALVKPETQKRLVLLPPASGQTSPGISSGVFTGNDTGASAVFAMTPSGYTVIVLANVGSVATPLADKILTLVSYIAVATDDVQPTSLTCAPASGARFSAGTTTVTCTAMDAASHSTSASFAITVLSASEQLALLRTAVIALRLAPDVQQGLLDKLDAAKQSIQASQSTIACNQLNAFANQAKAQTKKAVADGTNLLTRQNEIEAALDCVKSTAPPVLLGPRADVTTTTAPGKPTATVLFTGAS